MFSCGACWNEHKEGHAELLGCVDDLCVISVAGRAGMNTKRGMLNCLVALMTCVWIQLWGVLK